MKSSKFLISTLIAAAAMTAPAYAEFDTSSDVLPIADDTVYTIETGTSVSITSITNVSKIVVNGTLTDVNKGDTVVADTVPAGVNITGNGRVQVGADLQYHDQTFLEEFAGVVEVTGGTVYLGKVSGDKFAKISSLKLSVDEEAKTQGKLSFWGNSGETFTRNIELAGGEIIVDGTNIGISGAITVSADSTISAVSEKSLNISGGITGGKNLTKTGAGALTLSSNTSTYSGTLEISGGTVKLGALGQNDTTAGALGEQDKDGPGTRTAAVVKTGGTLDLNGKYDNGYKIELAGGTLTNSGGAMEISNRQLVGIKVSEDGSKVTVKEGKNFGLLAGSYNATSIDLGEKTLTKDGAGSLHLTATTIKAGTFHISEGNVYVRNGLADFKMESEAWIKLSNGATLTAFNDAANLQNEARNNVVTLGNVGIVLNKLATAVLMKVEGDAKFFAGDGAKLCLDISKLEATPVSDGETKALEIVFSEAGAFSRFYTNVEVGSWDADGEWAESDEWAFSEFDAANGKLTLTATVPEPSAFGLLAGIGALALVASRRRRK